MRDFCSFSLRDSAEFRSVKCGTVPAEKYIFEVMVTFGNCRLQMSFGCILYMPGMKVMSFNCLRISS